jgi:hypothetical protein
MNVTLAGTVRGNGVNGGVITESDDDDGQWRIKREKI